MTRSEETRTTTTFPRRGVDHVAADARRDELSDGGRGRFAFAADRREQPFDVRRTLLEGDLVRHQADGRRVAGDDATVGQVREERVGEGRIGGSARGAKDAGHRAPSERQGGAHLERVLGVIRGERSGDGRLHRGAERVGDAPLGDRDAAIHRGAR